MNVPVGTKRFRPLRHRWVRVSTYAFRFGIEGGFRRRAAEASMKGNCRLQAADRGLEKERTVTRLRIERDGER